MDDDEADIADNTESRCIIPFLLMIVAAFSVTAFSFNIAGSVVARAVAGSVAAASAAAAAWTGATPAPDGRRVPVKVKLQPMAEPGPATPVVAESADKRVEARLGVATPESDGVPPREGAAGQGEQRPDRTCGQRRSQGRPFRAKG